MVERCLNCRELIGENVFPHLCPMCLGSVCGSGRLPGGLSSQSQFEDEEE